MFRAAQRSSSGAPNCIFSLWFIYPCSDRPLSGLSGKWIHFPLSPDNGRSLHGYINQKTQIQFGATDDERCAARNMLSFDKLWNNKFYYKLHLVGISTKSFHRLYSSVRNTGNQRKEDELDRASNKLD